jgi:hypothetical protein
MELNLDWRRRQSALWPEVSYELRPLRVWAFQELLAFWEGEALRGGPHRAEGGPHRAEGESVGDGDAPADGPGAPRATLAATARLMDVARRILPDHVRGLSGLRVRAGSAAEAAVPTLEALCEEAALLPLAAELVAALVELSTLDAGAEKN